MQMEDPAGIFLTIRDSGARYQLRRQCATLKTTARKRTAGRIHPATGLGKQNLAHSKDHINLEEPPMTPHEN
jgi:hypothetical protein